MEIRIQGRRTGKSTDIAQIMKKDKKAICIQPTLHQKQHFMRIFKFKEKRVFTITEYILSCGLKADMNVYFDEVGCCLDMLCGRSRHNAKLGTQTNPGKE